MKIIFFCLSLLVFTSSSSFAGTIQGKITYEGKIPTFKPISTSFDKSCHTSRDGKELYPEVLVLGENNALANVFVSVTTEDHDLTTPAPEKVLEVTQKGCQFKPHVFGVLAGQTVRFLNPDETLHNVHAASKINKKFNLAMPKNRREAEVTFEKVEEMFPINCDVHPWMQAWCRVMPHSFFDITAKEGTYKIKNLKPGTYTLHAWHEKLGSQEQVLVVDEEGSQIQDFVFTRPS